MLTRTKPIVAPAVMDLGWVDMKTGEHTNEWGVRVTEHICDTCGVEYTICPGVDNWNNCLADNCDSYDPDCEVDLDNLKPTTGPRLIIH